MADMNDQLSNILDITEILNAEDVTNSVVDSGGSGTVLGHTGEKLFVNEINPVNKNPLSKEEINYFVGLFEIIPQGSPYDTLKRILERLTDIKLPELTADTRLQANWQKMYETWFFELTDELDNATL